MSRNFFAFLIVLLPSSVYPCSRMTPVDPAEMVRSADLIVVARAVGYDRAPSDPRIWTSGVPDSIVRFEIDEWVKGKGPTSLSLNAYLSAADDFNEQTVPYSFVRKGGRGGSCFANSYREGGRFLLVLKLRQRAYTVDWYALGPTNEQLHDGDDPWLSWVRTQLRVAKSRNAGSVHGTILYERESGNWVKVPGPIEVELRSQVAESRRVEVRNGEFSFSDVPQGGGYEVWVSPPQGLRSLPVQNICVGPGVVSVELKLRLKAYDERICVPCRGTLRGRALDSQGRPARGLAVTLLVGDKHFAAGRTRRNGTFQFTEVPEFRDVTVEIAREGLPVFRSTFEYRDPLSSFLQEPTPDQIVREFVLPDCPLPQRQPDSSLQPTPQAPASTSIRDSLSALAERLSLVHCCREQRRIA